MLQVEESKRKVIWARGGANGRVQRATGMIRIRNSCGYIVTHKHPEMAPFLVVELRGWPPERTTVDRPVHVGGSIFAND